MPLLSHTRLVWFPVMIVVDSDIVKLANIKRYSGMRSSHCRPSSRSHILRDALYSVHVAWGSCLTPKKEVPDENSRHQVLLKHRDIPVSGEPSMSIVCQLWAYHSSIARQGEVNAEFQPQPQPSPLPNHHARYIQARRVATKSLPEDVEER